MWFFTLLRNILCMIYTFNDDRTQHEQVGSQQSMWFTTKDWFLAKSAWILLNIFLQPKFFLGTRFPGCTTISTSGHGPGCRGLRHWSLLSSSVDVLLVLLLPQWTHGTVHCPSLEDTTKYFFYFVLVFTTLEGIAKCMPTL
jgi:hypothetical protein